MVAICSKLKLSLVDSAHLIIIGFFGQSILAFFILNVFL